MATQKEILERLDTAATNAEDATGAYYEVLTSEGEQDIGLVDGTTTPNLNKRIKNYVGAVKSVQGKTGEIVLVPSDIVSVGGQTLNPTPSFDAIPELIDVNGTRDPAANAQAQALLNLIYAFINNSKALDSVSSLLDMNTSGSFNISGFHSGTFIGGGVYFWNALMPKANHDGGIIIDPNKKSDFPSDWTNAAQVSGWLASTNTGKGCWVRWLDKDVTIFDYGFVADSAAYKDSNRVVFQQAVDKNIVVYVPTLNQPMYVKSGINVKNGRRIYGNSQYMGEALIADPDRGIIGDGSGPVFTTGTYPATANTNRQLQFDTIRIRNTNYPCIDVLHSDDIVLNNLTAFTSQSPAIRALFSARGLISGTCHIATTFTTYSDDNFAITAYNNCNGWEIEPTSVISGGTNGGGVDFSQSQDIKIDGIYESNGGYGIRVGGYIGDNLPDWAPSTVYARGDQVQVNNSSAQVCIVAHTSGATFDASKFMVTNGNCNGVSIGAYIEATNKPLSIGAKNLVLGCNLGKIYIGGANAPNPQWHIQLGAVTGLGCVGGVSIHRKLTEPTFNFVQPSEGSSITDYLTNSTLRNIHVQGGTGPEFSHNLKNAAFVGNIFGKNVLQLSAASVPSGQVREWISPTISASTTITNSAIILASGNGGVIDSIEVINATGTLGCTVRVGYALAASDNVSFDPSTLTYSYNAAAVAGVSPLIRPNQNLIFGTTAGSGTGTFRLRVRYRI